MKVLVDSDACPVKEIIICECKKLGVPVTMVCNTSHLIADDYSTVVTVEKGADSADIALINLAAKGDIVISQDFGVASMALGKGAAALNQNGMRYDDSNMDKLLFERHLGQKLRRSGGHTKGPKKRTKQQNEQFREAFILLLEQMR